MTTLSITRRAGRPGVTAHRVPTTAELVGGLALRLALIAAAIALSAPW